MAVRTRFLGSGLTIVMAACLFGAPTASAASPQSAPAGPSVSPPGADLLGMVSVAGPVVGCMLVTAFDVGPADTPNESDEIGMLCGSTLTPLVVPPGTDLAFGAQWSPDRSRIAFGDQNLDAGSQHLVTIAPDGSNQQIVPGATPNGPFSWTADGSSVVTDCQTPDGNAGLCTIDLSSGESTTLVPAPTDGSFDTSPDLSPAVDSMVFYRRYPPFHAGNIDLWTANSDGSGAKALVASPDKQEYRPTFSPDGVSIAYVVSDIPGPGDVHIRDLASGSDTALMTTPEDDDYPVWSPDGQSIVFSRANADGIGYDLYVIPAGGGDPTQIAHSDTLQLSVTDWIDASSSSPTPVASPEASSPS